MVKRDMGEQTSPAQLARGIGRRYWTLRPLCEMNGTVDLLDGELARGRLWASENGVVEMLEGALEAYGPKSEVEGRKSRVGAA